MFRKIRCFLYFYTSISIDTLNISVKCIKTEMLNNYTILSELNSLKILPTAQFNMKICFHFYSVYF